MVLSDWLLYFCGMPFLDVCRLFIFIIFFYSIFVWGAIVFFFFLNDMEFLHIMMRFQFQGLLGLGQNIFSSFIA